MTDQTLTQTGVEAVAAMFAAAKAQNRGAFLPYYPIGYPTYQESLNAIEAMAHEGVDGFEIGIPFSDPLADGPVIQAAAQVALENGMTTRMCLDAVRELRRRGVRQPFMLMGYINPILSYGVDTFIHDLRDAGADVFATSCGACAGYGGSIPDGANVISTTARNFKGRMGSETAQVYLASPYTVAASAVAGRIADPREFMA